MTHSLLKRAAAGVVGAYASLVTSAAFAQTPQDAPLFPTVQPTVLPTTVDFGILLTRVINYFLGLVGLIAVLMLVIGGLRYITSAGNEQTLEKAKHTILYAIIGIVIVILAYAIVYTVTNTLRTF